jgi:hypothetical protein
VTTLKSSAEQKYFFEKINITYGLEAGTKKEVPQPFGGSARN